MLLNFFALPCSEQYFCLIIADWSTLHCYIQMETEQSTAFVFASFLHSPASAFSIHPSASVLCVQFALVVLTYLFTMRFECVNLSYFIHASVLAFMCKQHALFVDISKRFLLSPLHSLSLLFSLPLPLLNAFESHFQSFSATLKTFCLERVAQVIMYRFRVMQLQILQKRSTANCLSVFVDCKT